MQHDEFIGQVQHRARLASRGEAERAVRATLETLGERLDGGAAAKLAGELPMEIGEHLRRMAGPADTIDLQDFFDRVAQREGLDKRESVFHTRCVIEVMDEATSGSLLAKVREQLPAEFDRLFEASSVGQMPAGG
jgi:uncharacterized protein (DUF2267 family)